MKLGKRKTGFIAFLVLLLLVFIGGCAKQESSQGIYKPGTYTGEGEGKNGPIIAKVTFTKDKIKNIDIVEHSETDGLSDSVLKEVPESIIKNQSLGIDAVTGASMTNQGLLDAIADAVDQAGGDSDSLRKVAIKEEKSTEVVDIDTDVVVVGGGASGIAAALRSEEQGLKTVLIEKMSFLGGAISISGGNQVVTGSKLQKQAGVENDSSKSMEEDFLKNGDGKNVPELLELFSENVGQTTDWLNETVGIEYDMEGGLHKLAEYSHDRELAYKDGGTGFAKTAREAVDKSSVEVFLNTKAIELIQDSDGKITGLVAEENNGKKYNISSKAVILATGGYGNNKDLLTPELQDVLYYGPESSTGDGLLMTEESGIEAKRRLMEYGKQYPNGIEVSPGKAKSTIGGNIKAFSEGAILINKNGERVVNEKASNREILTTELSQEDKMLYLLMDASTFGTFKEAVSEGGISESDINKWLKNNGKETPYFYHADTLEKLAEESGIDPIKLSKTVSRYNEFVKNGSDEDFNRPKEYLNQELTKGPFYLVEQKPRFATTMGGLVVNTKLEVLNKEDKVIPGLYAAGEVVGGVMGDDSPSGANNAWALTSGKLASETVKENVE